MIRQILLAFEVNARKLPIVTMENSGFLLNLRQRVMDD